MSIRLAVVGFRHAHILGLYQRAEEMEDIEIAAACEEDQTVREEVASQGIVEITHAGFVEMLADVDCDAVAVGDYYAKRGSLVIASLGQGKHVISDKPLCTSLDELDQIEELSSEKGLRVGCMLDMRDAAAFIGVRNLIRKGIIGEIHAISFGGQHPLLLGKRPAWYFEPGKHGGTINDIGVHAIDIIPWITGLRFTVINASRCWNALARNFPHFRGAGQMMLTMENGCGVLGDVSYFAPDSSGYSLPFYWRMTFWGRQGVIETSSGAREIAVALNAESGLRSEPVPHGNPGGYLKSFVRDIKGEADEDELCTAQVLRAARTTLMIQKAADMDLREVALSSTLARSTSAKLCRDA